MRQGWKPVRETAFARNEYNKTYILICLERA
jgi:hypothetical protein